MPTIPAAADGTANAEANSQSPAASGLSLATLKPRMAFVGKVTRVELGGVFVDIGADADGFLHVSQIVSDKPVLRVADIFRPGDEVQVYVLRVYPKLKRIDLTMHKPSAYDWSNLEVGSKLSNVRVVSIESFGVFVDFDGPKHGLIPFNLMPKGIRPKVGDQIDNVWVVEVDESKRRIGLTMIEPPALPWEKIKKGNRYPGRVTRVERNAAYVDIGAEREGIVRVSSLGIAYADMHAFVTEGEEVNVRVLKVDPHKRQIDLALEGINASDYALSSGPDEQLSPFAAALQRAQRIKRAQMAAAAAADRPAKKANPQNNLLEHTLPQVQAQKNDN
ncbi:MAG: S1 RNA-binding domain-containing protein [Thermoflexales bacterium]|nr:S1 RNA-binding domain-containing protein [Thermoflexales bacterium]MDW8351050.1 S1 RNA-binding domain-containing protein [Anaerolineae bacterium]